MFIIVCVCTCHKTRTCHEKVGRDLKVGIEGLYNVTGKQMKDLFGVKKGTRQK